MRDRDTLYATAFVRAVATGFIGVELGVYLTVCNLSPASAGVVISCGLAGAAAAGLFATWCGDRYGRRRLLVQLALVTALAAGVVAFTARPAVLAAAAFIGMLNGMGRDRGAALIIEQAILPATTSDAGRTRAFAYYNVLQDAGHAIGSLLAGVPRLVERGAGVSPFAGHRLALSIYVVLALAQVPLYASLTGGVESPEQRAADRVTPASRRLLQRIAALFALDSLAGGFLTTALLSYFFFERFGASGGVIGLLFFGARVMNALSHLGAAWLAARIGLVRTMVFTHIPSSILLVTVAFAPSFGVAAALFLLREGLVEMDVPTRQSYVLAVVRPEERAIASGVTTLVRMAAWAVGPVIAGVIMEGVSLMTPLVVGAAMKITYDVLLWRSFRSVRPPEEAG